MSKRWMSDSLVWGGLAIWEGLFPGRRFKFMKTHMHILQAIFSLIIVKALCPLETGWHCHRQGKMPLYSMSPSSFLCQPLMMTDLPNRTHSPRAQATQLRTCGRQIGFVDGGWTFSLPPDSEFRLRVTLNKSFLSAYRFKILLWTWMWHL